jgi:3-hydroxybutyryl-CoA dehydrogenase
MKIENMERVAVIGAGNMGSQIAQQLAHVGGYKVMLMDVSEELVNLGLGGIRSRLQRFFVEKGKMTKEEMDETIARIKGTTKIAEAVKETDLVIESVFERLDIKKEVFREVDQNAPPHTIIASNSSTLNITEISSDTGRKDKAVGMHFFNPVAVMKLVEVVRGAFTSDETVAIICDLARKLGKEPVVCKDYSFGFLANRAYGAMNREAVEMVWERVASPEDIDKALKLGYNLPIGPLELDDMMGGWKLKADSEADRIRELGEKGRLHPLIKIMVRAGYTGGPGKKGIYDFWKEVMNR